jgi:hypothetical protein
VTLTLGNWEGTRTRLDKMAEIRKEEMKEVTGAPRDDSLEI